MNAYIFGELCVIVENINKKGQAFQEKMDLNTWIMDLTTTTMKNIGLNQNTQYQVQQFLKQTRNSLDHQKDLEEFYELLKIIGDTIGISKFYELIPPSLKNQVINKIFEKALVKNEGFNNRYEIMTELIKNLQPLIVLPEQEVIQQGDAAKFIIFVSKGECHATVTNHMRNKVKSDTVIGEGHFFGEVSVIYNCPATATVTSLLYSICASIDKK